MCKIHKTYKIHKALLTFNPTLFMDKRGWGGGGPNFRCLTRFFFFSKGRRLNISIYKSIFYNSYFSCNFFLWTNHQENLENIIQVKFYILNIILSYLIVLFFLGPCFHHPNYTEMTKYLISKFLASMFQNILIGNFPTSWCSCPIDFLEFRWLKKTFFFLQNMHIT